MFWLLARSAKKLPLALALPVILAPTFLLYSPFYASAFTSVARARAVGFLPLYFRSVLALETPSR